MANSLYIASLEAQSGKSVVALGIMEMLSGMVGRRGYFRPIIPTAEKADNNIEVIRQRYQLEQTYQESFAFTHNAAQLLTSGDSGQAMLKHIVDCYRQLQSKCRFVLCEGTDFTGVSSAWEFDLNAEIASNLGCPILAVVNGWDKDADEIVTAAHLAVEAFTEKGCTVATIIVNRVDAKESNEVRTVIREGLDVDIPVFIIPEIPILVRPTVADIARQLKADVLQGGEDTLHRQVADFKVAAMNIPHFLDFIAEGDLVIAPGDRTDVILASLATVLSDTFPTIAGIMLTGGFEQEPQVHRLMDGFKLSDTPRKKTGASAVPFIV